EDDAMKFVLRLLTYLRLHPHALPPISDLPAWLHKAAFRHALNCRNARRRLLQREGARVNIGDETEQGYLEALPSPEPTPEEIIVQQAEFQALRAILLQVEPQQGELFLARYHEGASIEELARRFGRASHALEKTLSIVRRRLPERLAQHGWTE